MTASPRHSEERSALLIRALAALTDTNPWVVLQILEIDPDEVIATLKPALEQIPLDDLRLDSGEPRTDRLAEGLRRAVGDVGDVGESLEGASLASEESDRWNELVAVISALEFDAS